MRMRTVPIDSPATILDTDIADFQEPGSLRPHGHEGLCRIGGRSIVEEHPHGP